MAWCTQFSFRIIFIFSPTFFLSLSLCYFVCLYEIHNAAVGEFYVLIHVNAYTSVDVLSFLQFRLSRVCVPHTFHAILPWSSTSLSSWCANFCRYHAKPELNVHMPYFIVRIESIQTIKGDDKSSKRNFSMTFIAFVFEFRAICSDNRLSHIKRIDHHQLQK